MIGSFGVPELLVILVVVLLLFGAKRLPEIGSGLGEGIKNFKKGFRESKSIEEEPNREGVSTKATEKAGQKATNASDTK